MPVLGLPGLTPIYRSGRGPENRTPAGRASCRVSNPVAVLPPRPSKGGGRIPNRTGVRGISNRAGDHHPTLRPRWRRASESNRPGDYPHRVSTAAVHLAHALHDGRRSGNRTRPARFWRPSIAQRPSYKWCARRESNSDCLTTPLPQSGGFTVPLRAQSGADGESRTRTALAGLRVLSAAGLPFPYVGKKWRRTRGSNPAAASATSCFPDRWAHQRPCSP